ncbi:MAG TPA: hypothetical protein VK921_09235 [Anditalea sp.]|nr:hypothetical protein [Anditalea sp.]
MNTKLNQTIHAISFALVIALGIGGTLMGEITTRDILTYMIIMVAVMEALSLFIGRKFFSEKHTSFKIGVLATLLILLGIKTMMPTFFPALTITVLAVNFIYNFYTLNRRTTIRRRQKKKKLKF